MLKKLQNRFVFSALLAFTIVFLGLIMFINALMLVTINRKSNEIMSDIAHGNNSTSTTISDFLESIGSKDADSYQEIYLEKVEYKESGVKFIRVKPIHYFSNETAKKLLENIGDRKQGTYGNFKYKVYDFDDKIVTVVLDVGKDLFLLKSFRRYSIMGFLVCEIIVIILLLIFSDKAVRPMAENIDNQKRFIDNASHELKTPISIISANNELIELSIQKSKWTESTKRQVDRMSHLIDQMLILSNYEEDTDSEELLVQMTEVYSLTNQILKNFESIIRQKNITIISKGEKEFYIKGIKEQIINLFDIIVENAVKYTPENGEIIISSNKSSFFISNTSSEIKKEDLSKLFDRFYRVDKVRSRQNGGNGLGLSIAKKISEKNKLDLSANYKNQKFIIKVKPLSKEKTTNPHKGLGVSLSN